MRFAEMPRKAGSVVYGASRAHLQKEMLDALSIQLSLAPQVCCGFTTARPSHFKQWAELLAGVHPPIIIVTGTI